MRRVFLAVFAISLLAFLLLFFSGCGAPAGNSAVPEDFSLSYETGAMHLDWGHYLFRADYSGNASFTKTVGAGDSEISETKSFKVSREELLDIYNEALRRDFFSLKDSYEDPSIMDGGFSRISMTADGEKKLVSVLNTSVRQFDVVEEKITGLIYEKLGKDAFSLSEISARNENQT